MLEVDDVTDVELEKEFALPIETLDDPIQLFREKPFPDGHYRIYLEELRTGRTRLIIEVHVYEGQVVPPNYREGAVERQPGADEGAQAFPDDVPSIVDRTQTPQQIVVNRVAEETDPPPESTGGLTNSVPRVLDGGEGADLCRIREGVAKS